MIYMKKSIYSWISLIIGVWLILSVLVGMGVVWGLYGSFESPLFIIVVPLFFPWASLIWPILGIACGFIGIKRQETKKNLAIVGIVLSFGMLAYQGFGYLQYKTHPNTFPTEEQRNQPGFQP